MAAAATPEQSGFQRVQLRLAGMKSERNSWDSHWRELQEVFLTRRGRWITDSKTGRGDKRNQKMIDPTPRFAARTLGAGMHAGSTNPAAPWFKLTTPDPEMMEFPSVSQWLYAVENLMRDTFSHTNLYSVLPTTYTEAGVFGTAPILMLEHPTKVIQFVPKTVGSYYLATNSDGVVDTMYCEYTMTVRQLVDQFGVDACSDTVKGAHHAGRLSVYHDVLHVIEPRGEGREASAGSQHMPWRSAYYELGARDRPPLRESGFEDNPLAVFRWETTEITDPYGSSAGMDALGISRSIQVQTKRKAQVIDKHVDPPMVGDSALRNQPSSLLPGDITYAGFTANGSAPKFQPAMTVDPKAINVVLEDINDSRELIREALYTNLFLAITLADPRNATVPEIDARREEQILSLGPVLQNSEGGLLSMIIDRTFNIMARQGKLPEPPPELAGINLKVEFSGALAQAFKAIAAGKIERFVGFVGSVAKAQADSGEAVTAFDKFDADQSIDEYAMAIGVPPTVVRSDDAVAQLRDAKAQAAAAQAQAAAAQPMKDAAIAAKTMAETPAPGGGNMLEAVA
jgi:hypothetical protein